jgi:2-polyprenyl-6-methoxyphenol hydroxylase-like FAD-dependent oxidoreductase
MHEQEVVVDFRKSYDVVVCGAGVAGVAAALEAARAGLSVALVEKTVLTGGLATAGLVLIYLPLCDGNGTQVTFGIAEELLRLSLRYGPGEVPANWRGERDAAETRRYRVVFSPASFVLAIDEALEAAGVDVWLDTLFCRATRDGDRVTGIEVENKSGRGELRAGVVVDATGDADVAARAGAECALGQNFLSYWALGVSVERARAAADSGSAAPLLQSVRAGGDAWGHGHPADYPLTAGVDGREVSRFVLDGRRLLREQYQARQSAAGAEGRSAVYPLTLAAMPQYRTTRRIVGRANLTTGGENTARTDSIGLAADWRCAGKVWEIPYGALVPVGVTGLLAAGRCIGSGGDAWEVTRVIPGAALTGQAAGVAATLAVKGRTTPDLLDPAAVQAAMRARDVPLHLADVGLVAR